MRTPISAPWICPQCARTVPAREPRCHCGVMRIEAPAALRRDGEAPPSSSSFGGLVLAIVLVSAAGFGLYTAARQREQSLQAAQAAENERIRLETSPPPVAETARSAERAARASAPNPYPFAGGAASPSPFPGEFPSVRAEAAPLATRGRPSPLDDASPSPTAMEEAWARATELLEPPLQKIAAETSELQQRAAPFAQTCLASPDGNWLVAMKSGPFVRAGVPYSKYVVTLDCEFTRRELVARGNVLKAELAEAESLARTSGVLPGHWRKLVDMHQLDVWELY